MSIAILPMIDPKPPASPSHAVGNTEPVSSYYVIGICSNLTNARFVSILAAWSVIPPFQSGATDPYQAVGSGDAWDAP